MNAKREKLLAANMLYQRQHGYSTLYVLRKSAIRYLGLVVLFGLFCVQYRAGYLLKTPLVFFGGLVIGGLVRDAGWLRQIKQNWPFTERVIDWAKVQGIADNNSANQASQAIGAKAAPQPER